MTTTLRPGQTYSRLRGFRPAEYGKSQWWIVSLAETEQATAFGTEYVYIEDVATSKAGDIAVHRRWVADPDGQDVLVDWVPHRSELEHRSAASLQRALRQMHMELVTDTPAAPAPMAPPPPTPTSAKSNVVPFPSARCARLVQNIVASGDHDYLAKHRSRLEALGVNHALIQADISALACAMRACWMQQHGQKATA
jgi:hypothetical protein